MAYEFKFPDVGEGIHEGEIVRWRVKVGETVKEDQPLVEMETAKAIVEIPSPRAGKILTLNGKEGETVKVGTVLVVIDDGKPNQTQSPGVIGQIPTEEQGVILPPRNKAPANPKFAKTAEFGPVERVKIHSIKKAVAQNMAKSARQIPHVTHMDEFDASALVKMHASQKTAAEKKKIKLTYLPFIIKAVIKALKKFPEFNAEYVDGMTPEIVYKKYFNIGIAVDTPDGLMVPVIKNADKKDIFELANEIVNLAEQCRTHKIDISSFAGATFTITNIGSVGGTFATPLIVPGQSAILGVLRMKEKPVAVGGKVEICPVLPLALSFDHRACDGAGAARFMNEIILELQNFIS